MLDLMSGVIFMIQLHEIGHEKKGRFAEENFSDHF